MGELICVKLQEFQKKVKSNDSGYRALLFNADNKRQKINKLKEVTKELEKERSKQTNERLQVQMEEKKNILVNKSEQDFRETLGEIVKKYPFVKRQRAKLLEIQENESKSPKAQVNYT